jgi:hypothetical protein
LSLPDIEEPIVVVSSLSNFKDDMQVMVLTEFIMAEARVKVAVNILFTDVFEEYDAVQLSGWMGNPP